MEYKAEFDNLNTVILGVSRDKIKANKRFRDNNNIIFDLLSDEESSICNQFGVLAEKSLYGRKYIGIDRSTFVFNVKGELIKEYRNVKVKGHVEIVLKELCETLHV